VREFLVTDRGVEFRDIYTGPAGGLLTGSARSVLEAREKAETLVRAHGTASKRRELAHKEQAMKAQVAVLRLRFEIEQAEALRSIEQADKSAALLATDRARMSRLRQANPNSTTRPVVQRKTRRPA
jgi:circadian clock protein KaiC